MDAIAPMQPPNTIARYFVFQPWCQMPSDAWRRLICGENFRWDHKPVCLRVSVYGHCQPLQKGEFHSFLFFCLRKAGTSLPFVLLIRHFFPLAVLHDGVPTEPILCRRTSRKTKRPSIRGSWSNVWKQNHYLESMRVVEVVVDCECRNCIALATMSIHQIKK
jgi:hypothetical protein